MKTDVLNETTASTDVRKIKMGLTACAEPRMEVIVYLAAGGLALPNH